MVDSRYKLEWREFEKGEGLPRVSTALDSVRAFQFEVHFFGIPESVVGEQTDLTLAAKQVSPVGVGTDDIEVRRVNDKLFFPGAPTLDELSITFDNLYKSESARALWEWFKATYDPLTGDMTKLAAPGGGSGTFKAHKLRIVQLDNTRTPHAAVELYGVYPKSWRAAEHNYSTNDFHTVEVTFRYDFMDYFNYGSENQ